MMRFGAIFTFSVAVAAGIGLYHAKYRVLALESELAQVQQHIQRDREAIHVLKAEWSFLNEPDRLAELARRSLEMAPVAGSQLATIADVPEKLPLIVPETPPSDDMPGEDAPAHEAPRQAPLIASAPAPVIAPAPAPAAPPPFAGLPADVQAVLASMRTAE
jgi:cell division protein FtsL